MQDIVVNCATTSFCFVSNEANFDLIHVKFICQSTTSPSFSNCVIISSSDIESTLDAKASQPRNKTNNTAATAVFGKPLNKAKASSVLQLLIKPITEDIVISHAFHAVAIVLIISLISVKGLRKYSASALINLSAHNDFVLFHIFIAQ